MQSEKEKTHAAEIMTEECQDKLRQAEQERDYALSHQKKVEIPVEKPVLYQKCGNCNLTAYLKAKEKYDTQREKLAGRYKTKTAMYEALMFLLIWYSVSTTLFVSNDSANRHSTVFHAVPLTSKIHKKTYLPTHIFISSFKAVGLRTNSIAQCEQLCDVKDTDLIEKIGKVSKNQLRQITKGMQIQLGMSTKHNNPIA